MNGIFRGKVHGTATVGERGQIVIPADVRDLLRIRAGERLMVMVKPERKIIALMRTDDFDRFLGEAAKMIARMKKKVSKKNR
jgi:AbrB family looped-hinge helix DNA binding protein